MKSDLVDIEVEIRAETDRAIMVAIPDREPVWLPLSQCEVELTSHKRATVTMPEWLAIEKGLV